MQSALHHHASACSTITEHGITARCKELIMPPLVDVPVKARRSHDAKKQEPVGTLARRDAHGIMMSVGSEIIDRAAHVELAPIHIQQRDIDRNAPAVGRATTGVSDIVGVGRMIPQRPLRFGRAEGIRDLQAQVLFSGISHSKRQTCRCIGMQKATRIAVDAFAHEVVIMAIDKVDNDVETGRADFDQQRHDESPERIKIGGEVTTQARGVP